MLVLRLLVLGVVCLLGVAPSGARAQETGIIVNGQPLTAAEVGYYDIRLPPGRYWYDRVSGFWGVEGGPYVGQVMPELPLGGPLQPDASQGNTGVFINNREIHLREYLELVEIFGQVPPGRYWLNASLIGGLEGQPASFNLNPAGAPAAGEGGAGGSGYFEDQVSDFCMRHACPSDLRGAIDDMNSYVPDFGTE